MDYPTQQPGPPGTNFEAAMAHVPETWAHLGAPGRYFRHHPTLDLRRREVAILQVTVTARCTYAYIHHVKILLEEAGVAEAEVRALISRAGGGGDTVAEDDASTLLVARQLSETASVEDGVLDELRDRLGTEGATELLACIAYYGTNVRILNAMRVPLEDRYDDLLATYPAPW